MKTHLRMFWLVSLTFFVSGCSGFQPACYTRTGEPGDGNMSSFEVCNLRAGEEVRITTTEGTRVIGEINRITPEGIVLRPNRFVDQPLVFSPSQIKSIERSNSRPSASPEMNRPEKGDDVSLYLVDGSRVDGEVLVFNDKEIVLDNKGHSSQPAGYPMEQVQWLVVKNGGGTSWTGPVVAIVVIGLAVGCYMLYQTSQSLDSMWGN